MDLRSCLQPEMGQGPDTERRLVAHRHARHRDAIGAQTIILENPPPNNGASTVVGGTGALIVRAAGDNSRVNRGQSC